MAISLCDDRACFLRLHAQRLTSQQPDAASSVASIVRDLGGIQAQDASAAALAVRVRSVGLVADDVEYARVQERSIVRTWGPRSTLHLLATEDLNWLLPLLGPVFIAGGRRRRAQLGLDEDTCARGMHAMRDILANQGPLTRDELTEQLTLHGIQLVGQARPHLIARAALEGMICLGPNRGTEPTYVLLNDWIDQEHRGPHLSETEAHAELTRRYLNAYGPATPQDQAVWSGMSMNKTRAAWQHIADELIEVEIAGSPAWMLKTNTAWLDEPLSYTPIVRLLPYFDIYLLGYQNRNLSVPSQYAKRINAGGGMVHPTVLVDGRAVGIWKSKREKNHLNISVEPFGPLPPEILPALEAEVNDIARFMGTQAILHIMTLP